MIARALREALIIAAVAALPATGIAVRHLKWRTEKPLQPGEIDIREARQSSGDNVWVDARPAQKFARKHLPNAVNLSADEWDALVPGFLDAWSPDKTIIVYGDREGDAASGVAHRLREELKIENVWVLRGGIDEWDRP